MTTNNDTFTLNLYTEDADNRPVYIVGNFNDWRITDEGCRMEQTAPHHYQLKLSTQNLPLQLEYKYARGSWDYVELGDDGAERPNRSVARREGHVDDKVYKWKQDTLSFADHLLPKIEILGNDLQMPEHIRTRRIAALLPHDYYETDKHYPVLYLQDGQNLFDDYAPYGNWAVDKRLAQLQGEGNGDVIIIAIDHAMDKRIVEFTPSTTSTQFGQGFGRKYVRFLAEILKPYVDQRFRTLSDHNNTGIGGSSMGGLISIYAGMMYANIYGKLMIFSPSLWVTPNIQFQLLNLSEPYRGRVYLYGGKKESDTMVPNLQRLKHAMENQNRDAHHRAEFFLSIDHNGEHTEDRWGQEFPSALRWLFFNN